MTSFLLVVGVMQFVIAPTNKLVWLVTLEQECEIATHSFFQIPDRDDLACRRVHDNCWCQLMKTAPLHDHASHAQAIQFCSFIASRADQRRGN